jgi:hypothetical protein
VVGDIPELGRNDVRRAVQLNVMNDSVWSITIPVTLRENHHNVNYRYYVGKYDDSTIVLARESTTRYAKKKDKGEGKEGCLLNILSRHYFM